MKIKKLEIRNFKFFDEVKALEFDSKNILIYGENGSGKSTIYWALYTLLQSSKKDKEKIKKYFTSTDNSSLVNIYGDENDSKIELINEDDKRFTISKNSITIHDENETIEKSLYTSDFINYKYLFRFFNFLHRDKIDLFDLFEYEILHFLNTKDGINLYELWKEVLELVKRKPKENSKASAKKTKVEAKEERDKYKEIKQKLEQLNETLISIILDLNEPAKDYLRDNFGYDKIKLELTVVGGIYDNQEFTKPEINIKLSVLKNGDYETVLKPQSYFNEAKLTAIALSVRLAITQIKLKTSPLKLLILDDLLISLDMSNRDKVLDILFTDDNLKDYQKIILTHDRAFFEMAKQKFNYKQRGEWKYFEMYVDDKGEFEKPFILPHRDYFEKAEYFLLKYDYSACANYLRKEAERLLKAFVCHHRDLSCEETKNLQTLIDKAKIRGSLREKENIVDRVRNLVTFEAFEKFIEFDIRKLSANEDKKTIGTVRTELKRFKEFSTQEIEGLNDTLIMLEEFKSSILNPQSHDDNKVPLYKKELEDAVELIRKIKDNIEDI